ncbi:MAG: hypothetical protein II942_01535 [Alphaproteobacteria bacterium]|nr:hypothetical protein [Alphaproteobacteria bacterium]
MKKLNKVVFAAILLTAFGVCAEETGFQSLKSDQVNLRAGPAERFPIKWVYQERNYPVEVIDSFEMWRQIREVDGTLGWVHQKMLKPTRYVLIQSEDKLLSTPTVSGKVIAYVQPGVVGKVHSCPAGDYCRLQFVYQDKQIEGWFPRRFVWGLYDGEVIE